MNNSVCLTGFCARKNLNVFCFYFLLKPETLFWWQSICAALTEESTILAYLLKA